MFNRFKHSSFAFMFWRHGARLGRDVLLASRLEARVGLVEPWDGLARDLGFSNGARSGVAAAGDVLCGAGIGSGEPPVSANGEVLSSRSEFSLSGSASP